MLNQVVREHFETLSLPPVRVAGRGIRPVPLRRLRHGPARRIFLQGEGFPRGISGRLGLAGVAKMFKALVARVDELGGCLHAVGVHARSRIRARQRGGRIGT